MCIRDSSMRGPDEDVPLVNKHRSHSQQHHKKAFRNQSYGDGNIEVMAMTSVVHLGQCQSGFSKPIRVAQGSDLEIELKPGVVLPMQIDGEPMEVHGPLRIKLRHLDKVNVLAKDVPESVKIEAKLMEVLEWAQEHQYISSQHRPILMKEFKRKLHLQSSMQTFQQLIIAVDYLILKTQ
eukprot:TRINITY_DN7543_c0_g1_i2.p1 TRINITY_DN7543_c0_g1~~TRINITY_DN7543_c0_g1_i2.p1  ORF type:complete len:195 (-),score=19.07 TRINITY_DN7543_c0_g1_i2:21-557(-)